jgi:hypothetical protein
MLVGRERERDDVERVLERARSGESATLAWFRMDRKLLLVANTTVLCCRRFASTVDFSAAGDEFSTRTESVCL